MSLARSRVLHERQLLHDNECKVSSKEQNQKVGAGRLRLELTMEKQARVTSRL